MVAVALSSAIALWSPRRCLETLRGAGVGLYPSVSSAGARHSPALSIGRLAQVAVLQQPTVTRMLDRMEAKRQVERLAHDRDRRVTLVRITAAGNKIVARPIALAHGHETRVLEPFDLQRAEELKATLRRIIELHANAEGND